MSNKTKRGIANATWGLACFYLALAHIIYVLPAVAPTVGAWLTGLGAISFFLIPVSMVLGIAAILLPFVLIFFVGFLIDMGMSKLLGIEFP